MFEEVGHCYIYRSYGMHLCFNVVAHEAGKAGGILIRAGEVTAGYSEVQARRDRATDLANGPGRLGQALGLDLTLNGSCLLEGPLRLTPPERPLSAAEIARGPRVGISKAVDLPLRFWLIGESAVSRGRPGPALKGRRSVR